MFACLGDRESHTGGNVATGGATVAGRILARGQRGCAVGQRLNHVKLTMAKKSSNMTRIKDVLNIRRKRQNCLEIWIYGIFEGLGISSKKS
jgi:hypothetical protein